MYYKDDLITVFSDGMLREWRVMEVENDPESGKQRIRACLPSRPRIKKWFAEEDISVSLPPIHTSLP